MAALPEKNDCAHRGVCKYVGDGMCLTECGHYTAEEKFNSSHSPTNSDYTAALYWLELELGSTGSKGYASSVCKQLRERFNAGK